jgi:hypothetical protein
MTAACGVLVASGAPTSGRRVGCRPRNRTCDPCLGSGPRSRWLDAEGREEPIGPTAMPHGELARNDQRPPAARRQREQPILVDQRGERAAGGAAACRHVARGGMRGGVQVTLSLLLALASWKANWHRRVLITAGLIGMSWAVIHASVDSTRRRRPSSRALIPPRSSWSSTYAGTVQFTPMERGDGGLVSGPGGSISHRVRIHEPSTQGYRDRISRRIVARISRRIVFGLVTPPGEPNSHQTATRDPVC